MSGSELAVRESTDFMPVLTISDAVNRYNAIVEFTKTVMKADKDFGVIPGTNKPTLLKPGAEKLCTLFGLKPDFQNAHVIEDWEKGFFYYAYKCVLTRGGQVIAAGIGSCNSKEKKYRYRKAEIKCPKCGRATVLRSKTGNPPGWFCWTKKGGCGLNFAHDDDRIVGQPSGLVENTEPFELVNTIQKMAQKRALVAATLIATNASEFFTQDVEDMAEIVNPDDEEIIEGHIEPPPRQREEQPAAPREPDANEQFVIRFREAFEARDFKPNEISAAVSAVCAKKKIHLIDKLSNADRQAFIQAITDGRFDKFKEKETANA